MMRSLTKYSVFIIILGYLAVILVYTTLYLLADGKNTYLSSNELGDFLAGVFAPLAFVFLCLGYRKQVEGLHETQSQILKQLEYQLRELEGA